MDNVLFMQEMVRNYHRNSGPPRCAFKIDIQKAYDSLDLVFLWDVLRAMQLPEQMVKWIKNVPQLSISLQV